MVSSQESKGPSPQDVQRLLNLRLMYLEYFRETNTSRVILTASSPLALV